jgi:hypothetical protein
MHNVVLIIEKKNASPPQAASANVKESRVVADSDQDNVSGKCW